VLHNSICRSLICVVWWHWTCSETVMGSTPGRVAIK